MTDEETAVQNYWADYYKNYQRPMAPDVGSVSPSEVRTGQGRKPVYDPQTGEAVKQWGVGPEYGAAGPTLRNIGIGIDRFGNSIMVPFGKIAQGAAEASHSLFGTPETHGDWSQDMTNKLSLPSLTPGTPTERVIGAGAEGAGGNVPLSALTRSITPMMAGGAFNAAAQAAKEYGGGLGQQAAPWISGVGGLVSGWPIGAPGWVGANYNALRNAYNTFRGGVPAARALVQGALDEGANIARTAEIAVPRILHGDIGQGLGGLASAVTGIPALEHVGRILGSGGHLIGRGLRQIVNPGLYARIAATYPLASQLQSEQFDVPGAVNPGAMQ
jgi:hypothetical protein